MSTTDLLRRAIELARAGHREEARSLLAQVVEIEPRNETAWAWLSGLMDSLEERIAACENVLAINPDNEKARAYLMELRRQQAGPVRDDAAVEVPAQQPGVPASKQAEPKRGAHSRRDPWEAAADLEAEGRLSEAIQLYRELAAGAKSSYDFDRLYAQIVRLEQLQREDIRHVPALMSILRLTSGWGILYAALVWVQSGLNPAVHVVGQLWAALPVILCGGFFLSVVEVRSRNILWQRLFAGGKALSWLARSLIGAAGWVLILLPGLLLFASALQRLGGLQIPPMPPL